MDNTMASLSWYTIFSMIACGLGLGMIALLKVAEKRERNRKGIR